MPHLKRYIWKGHFGGGNRTFLRCTHRCGWSWNKRWVIKIFERLLIVRWHLLWKEKVIFSVLGNINWILSNFWSFIDFLDFFTSFLMFHTPFWHLNAPFEISHPLLTIECPFNIFYSALSKFNAFYHVFTSFY